MKTQNITLVIADDHPLFRSGLRQAIESNNEFSILAEASDGEEALKNILHHNPQIAILDMDMPKLKGLDVLKQLSKEKSDTDVIILTMYDEEDMFNRAIDLGVMGYVLKENAVSDIIDSIRSVASGKQYISPSICGYLITRTKKVNTGADTKAGISALTVMQRKVLQLISENKTTKEIANMLFISPKTVERHRSNICDKLNITGNNALLKFVIEHKNLL
jgi:DNA-binding NarL/FixJ family response regulator